MRQRPNLSPISRVYRVNQNDLALTAGAGGSLTFVKSDFGFASPDTIRPTLLYLTLGVATNAGTSAPVQVRMSWVVEGVSNMRTIMVSPGTQRVFPLRIPASTDFDTVAANTPIVEIHAENMSSTAATNLIAQVEGWFSLMPPFP